MDPLALVQEYISLLYEKYDSVDMLVPTAMGITGYMQQTLIEKLSEKKQNALFLLPNKATSSNEYTNFCSRLNTPPISTVCGCYEFPNGSIIHFLPYNQVQQVIYKFCDVIILAGLYFNLDKLNMEFVEKVKKINKVIVINCEIDKAKYVLFDKDTYLFKVKKMDDLSHIKGTIRTIKLKKIKEENERRNDRSISMAR